MLGCLLLAGALLWASGRDPFKRVWFEVNSPPAGRVRCLAVLPKPVRPRPAVIYLHGAGGSLVNDGPDLRQMAESGLAVVSVEYDQRNAVAADAQVAAVLSHLGRQGWADTNAIVWAGFSLGANRALGFALRHPELQPRLLVNLAGGGGEELQAARAPALRCPVWLVHGKGDEVFPLAQVQGLAAWLRGNGVAAELRALADLPHNFGPERGVVFRLVGEHCLTQLRGAAAWQDFQSAAEWRATATPLWVWWLPAALCAGAAWWWRQPTRPTDGGRASCWVAAVFVAVALAIGAIQLVLPRLPVSDWALALARRWLVPTEAQADFAWLSVQPVWRGQSLGILLEHTELTHYTRGLVPWKPADQFYREWVLSPVMGTDRPVDLGWRRPLWESLYPRIRKESSPEAAAEIVVRHLRERVSVTGAAGQVARPSVAWQRQMTDGAGFERLCVAGLRAVGIPARRRADGRAELWNGATWQPAPWPLAL